MHGHSQLAKVTTVLLAIGAILMVAAAATWLWIRHATYSELDAILATLERQHTQRIVLSETPTMIGATDTRFAPGELLEVKGMTGEFCLLLTRDADQDNFDAQYRQLLGGAQIKAVLHARGGKDYRWTRGGWQAYGTVRRQRSLLACLWLPCNEERPPKGTGIESIEVSASQPLRILGASWYSTDYFDSAYGSGANLTAGTACGTTGAANGAR
jgi:hypothetical protein